MSFLRRISSKNLSSVHGADPGIEPGAVTFIVTFKPPENWSFSLFFFFLHLRGEYFASFIFCFSWDGNGGLMRSLVLLGAPGAGGKGWKPHKKYQEKEKQGSLIMSCCKSWLSNRAEPENCRVKLKNVKENVREMGRFKMGEIRRKTGGIWRKTGEIQRKTREILRKTQGTLLDFLKPDMNKIMRNYSVGKTVFLGFASSGFFFNYQIKPHFNPTPRFQPPRRAWERGVRNKWIKKVFWRCFTCLQSPAVSARSAQRRRINNKLLVLPDHQPRLQLHRQLQPGWRKPKTQNIIGFLILTAPKFRFCSKIPPKIQ